MRQADFGPAGETFMGVPACPDPARPGGRVAVIGAGMATPYRSAGAASARAPAAIRAAASADAPLADHVNFDLGTSGWAAGQVVDCGDLLLDPADAAGNRLRIRQAVAALRAAGAAPVVLGGDASVLVPVLQGCAGQFPPDKVPLDPTGAPRGRASSATARAAAPAVAPDGAPAAAAEGPLALVQMGAGIGWREQLEGERWGAASAVRRCAEMAHVGTILQIGARGPDTARAEDLAAARARGVRLLSAADLRRGGATAALAALPAGAPRFLALDAALFDPAFVPAVAVPRAGGLDYGTALDLLGGIAGGGPIAGAVVTGLVPDHDVNGRGTALIAQFVAALLGLLAGR